MREDYFSGDLPKPNLANLDAYLGIGAAFDHDAEEFGAQADPDAIYRDGLAALHRQRPMAADGRLWTEEPIAAADAPTHSRPNTRALNAA